MPLYKIGLTLTLNKENDLFLYSMSVITNFIVNRWKDWDTANHLGVLSSGLLKAQYLLACR
jgi:hypothetical protein